MPSFTIRSRIATTPDRFWSAMSMRAVNAELNPLVHMTAPAHWRRCPLPQWETGRTLFRSWILLFGVLPVDRHALQLTDIDPAGGFRERPQSWANKLWQHERRTEVVPGGCEVMDTVTVHSRMPGMAVLMLPIYRLVFSHRHRRLKAHWGSV